MCSSTTSGEPRSSRADRPEWNTPVWSHDLDKGLRILRLGIDTHIITAHYLLPLLIASPGGLLVEVTDGTSKDNDAHYRISVFYDLVKTSVDRLAYSQGHELTSHAGTAVAITPGWLRSEMMLEHFAVTEDNWRDSLTRTASPQAPPGFAVSESPRYVGRAVTALAADPERHRWNQRSVTSGVSSPSRTHSPISTAHGRTSGAIWTTTRPDSRLTREGTDSSLVKLALVAADRGPMGKEKGTVPTY